MAAEGASAPPLAGGLGKATGPQTPCIHTAAAWHALHSGSLSSCSASRPSQSQQSGTAGRKVREVGGSRWARTSKCGLGAVGCCAGDGSSLHAAAHRPHLLRLPKSYPQFLACLAKSSTSARSAPARRAAPYQLPPHTSNGKRTCLAKSSTSARSAPSAAGSSLSSASRKSLSLGPVDFFSSAAICTPLQQLKCRVAKVR